MKKVHTVEKQPGQDAPVAVDGRRDRIGEAREDMSSRSHDQIRDWREQFGSAADDALRELGRWTIRSQRSPDALAELSKEITKREAEITS